MDDMERIQCYIRSLESEIEELKTKLKKYTNPESNKKYRQTHKDEIKQRNYKKTVPTEEQRSQVRR